MFLDGVLNGSSKHLAAPFADIVVFARYWGFHLDQVTVPVREAEVANPTAPVTSRARS
jgi:hypothetical protein